MSTLNLQFLCFLSYFLFINKGSFQVLEEIFIGGVVFYKDRTKYHIKEQKRESYTLKCFYFSLDSFLPYSDIVLVLGGGQNCLTMHLEML